MLYALNFCFTDKPNVSRLSGVRRKFPRGDKFCHNCVTSQINFGPGACTRKNFAKLHLKIRIFVHSGSTF